MIGRPIWLSYFRVLLRSKLRADVTWPKYLLEDSQELCWGRNRTWLVIWCSVYWVAHLTSTSCKWQVRWTWSILTLCWTISWLFFASFKVWPFQEINKGKKSNKRLWFSRSWSCWHSTEPYVLAKCSSCIKDQWRRLTLLSSIGVSSTCLPSLSIVNTLSFS